MKTLVLDAFSGISGDMFLGALFSLGLSQTDLENELAKLHVSGFHLTVKQTERSSISGVDFDVVLADHQHKDNGVTEHGHHHGRNFQMIQTLLQKSTLKEKVKQRALMMFKEIALAESQVHHKDLNEVHFHEVGALDSIVDLVGAAIAVELLGIDQIVVNNLADGTGTIKIAHGVVPVPVPAVMQMRLGTNIPVQQRFDVHTELVTPTGMAIVKCLAQSFNVTTTPGVLEKTGYGFGKRATGSLNALRASLFNSKLSAQEVAQTQDQVMLLETNLDDITGEQLGDAIQGLMELGAKDAWSVPIMMKKGRPAYKLCVLLAPQQKQQLLEYLFAQTSAIGVRSQLLQREIMQRQLKTAKTSLGEIKIKQLSYQGISKFSLEHDELLRLAAKWHRPVFEVEQQILVELQEKVN
ncbi:nickel pincer cofactor biosynthesis protein LarC [Liquorilactobacillus satsumensis]|uniref:nickel pincer cofactor biosynthesis protein LarC n=1 Tax=Liquorilactobacillus satsumensis TaxID=259059 RepID=UPI0039E81410